MFTLHIKNFQSIKDLLSIQGFTAIVGNRTEVVCNPSVIYRFVNEWNSGFVKTGTRDADRVYSRRKIRLLQVCCPDTEIDKIRLLNPRTNSRSLYLQEEWKYLKVGKNVPKMEELNLSSITMR